MNDLQNMAQKAKEMLSAKEFDEKVFRDIESFVIKNQQAMSNDAGFASLKDLVDDIARKHDLPTIREQQENFGLNSCAC